MPTGTIKLERAFIGWRVTLNRRALDLGWRPHLEHGWVVRRWFLTHRRALDYAAGLRAQETYRAQLERDAGAR